MPRGIYIRTEQYRKNMSKAMLGKKRSQEYVKRMRNKFIENLRGGMLGRHHTEETKRKISILNKGRNGAQGSNNGSFKKGHIPWCAGKKLPSRSLEYRKKLSLIMKGKKSHLWKHGLSYTEEYIRLMKKRRTAFERGGGKLTTATVQIVYEDNIKKYGTLTCIYCLKPIEFGKDTLEHKTPLSRGGTNLYKNLAVACNYCNSKKRFLTEEEFLEKGQGGFPIA